MSSINPIGDLVSEKKRKESERILFFDFHDENHEFPAKVFLLTHLYFVHRWHMTTTYWRIFLFELTYLMYANHQSSGPILDISTNTRINFFIMTIPIVNFIWIDGKQMNRILLYVPFVNVSAFTDLLAVQETCDTICCRTTKSPSNIKLERPTNMFNRCSRGIVTEHRCPIRKRGSAIN